MAIIIQTVDGVVTNRFIIESTALTFGRTADNQVQINDKAVSNKHAHIIHETSETGEDHYFLEDLGSTNGSFVNETRIERQRLHHKDNLRIGLNVFTFLDENQADIEKTSEIKKSWIPGVYYSED